MGCRKIYTYKKGVSLLLRDSLHIPPKETEISTLLPNSAISDPSTALEKHVCITDHKATVRERVGDTLFDYTAGSFFQNNNSVLVPLTSYVRDAIFPPPSSAITTANGAEVKKPTYLVDAYCGAGLFALTLAPHFTHVAGIELSTDSIRSATHNATLNSLSHIASFRSGDAADIFARCARTMHVAWMLRGCDSEAVGKELVGRCGAGYLSSVAQ